MENNKDNVYELGKNTVYLKDRKCVVSFDGVLEEIPSDILPKIKKMNVSENNRSLTTELIILPSFRCNLKCVYCSDDSNSKDKACEIVKEENIKKAIDFVIKNAVLLKIIKKGKVTKPARIIFSGGGEPTIEWNLIVFAVELVKEYRAKYGSDIALLEILTNAQEEDYKIDYLIENFDQIHISCDGFSVQEIQRPRVDKQSSLKFVENMLQKLNLARKKASIRMTVTGDGIATLYRDIKTLLDEYDNIDMVVPEPYNQVGRGTDTNISELKYDEFIKVYDLIAREYYGEVYNSSTLLEFANFYPCQRLSGISIVLSAFNVLTCCDTVVATSELWSQMVVSSLNTDINIEKSFVWELPIKCKGCIAEEYCAGGCPMLTGNLDIEEKTNYCFYRKEAMKDELRRRLDLSKKTKEYEIDGKKCRIYELPRQSYEMI